MEERIIKDINNLFTQLFQKMKEAGYEWDAKKKELKKISQRMVSAEAKEVLYNKITDVVMDKDNIDDFAYQCAYDLSKDWLYENASWDDVQIACKLGAKWYEAHHKVQWSERDEKNLQGIIDEIQANKNSAPPYDIPVYEGFLNWLKSLKNKVQPQPKQEWSEEDEKMLHNIENCVHRCVIVIGTVDKVRYIDWLKSIKERIGGNV